MKSPLVFFLLIALSLPLIAAGEDSTSTFSTDYGETAFNGDCDTDLKSNRNGFSVGWNSVSDDTSQAEIDALWKKLNESTVPSPVTAPPSAAKQSSKTSLLSTIGSDLIWGGELFSAHVVPELFEQGLWAIADASGLAWPFILGYVMVMGGEATYEWMKGNSVLAESILVHMACDLTVMLGLKLFNINLVEQLFAYLDGIGLGCIKIPFSFIHDVLHKSADYILSVGRSVLGSVEITTAEAIVPVVDTAIEGVTRVPGADVHGCKPGTCWHMPTYCGEVKKKVNIRPTGRIFSS